jgi:hypothetical protein
MSSWTVGPETADTCTAFPGAPDVGSSLKNSGGTVEPFLGLTRNAEPRVRRCNDKRNVESTRYGFEIQIPSSELPWNLFGHWSRSGKPQVRLALDESSYKAPSNTPDLIPECSIGPVKSPTFRRSTRMHRS